MPGYDGYSKSNNALDAEAAGRFPLTELVRRLRASFPGVVADDVRAVTQPCEWHHTSCHYNRTEYWDLREFDDAEAAEALRERIEARKEYAALYQQATKAGVIWLLVPETGEQWYPVRKPVDLASGTTEYMREESRRLRATLERR